LAVMTNGIPDLKEGYSEGRSLAYDSRDAGDRCRELGLLGQSRERGTSFWSVLSISFYSGLAAR
jgi:hypothetical protein